MPTCFITGKDELLIREEVRKLARKVEVDVFHTDDVKLDAFTQHATTSDLFSSERVLWLKDVASLPRSKKTAEMLAALCKRIPAHTTVVFSQNLDFGDDYRKASAFRSSAVAQALEKAVDRAIEPKLVGRQLRRWILTHAEKSYGLRLEERQAEELAQLADERPALVDMELRKLSLLKQPGATASVRDPVFRAVVSRAIGGRMRQLVDTALERDIQAFNLAADASRTESLGHDFYRDFYRGLQRLLAIRTDPQFRSRPEFKALPQFVVEKLRAAAPKWSTQSLLDALVLVTRAEFRMRTGRVAGRSPQAAELNLLLMLLKQVFATPS